MMKLLSCIFFFGVYFLHWTTAVSPPIKESDPGNIDVNGILLGLRTPASAGHIDLSAAGITNIAETAFANLTKITSLDLSNNNLAILSPRMFSELISLEKLSLANNNIVFVDKPFIGLSHLKDLNLSNNSIMFLKQGALFGLTKSTEINIEGNHLLLLSSGVFQDPSASVPAFKKPPRDEYSKGNDNDSLPDRLLTDDFQVKLCKTDDGLVTSVEELKRNESLGNCKIQFHSYRRLYLNNHQLKRFQRGWYKLPGGAFDTLVLNYNDITDITPEFLNDLPSGLSSIDLSNNKIEIIRRNIIENRYLEELNLGFNPLSKIEDGAFEKINLITFDASATKLDNLDFVRTLPTTIENFYFSRNLVSEIPVNIFRGFKNLKLIDLSENLIENIKPKTFEDQKSLLELKLCDNEISELSSGIFEGLRNLTKLNFGDNMIGRISRGTFSDLKNSNRLEIDLTGNEIDTIEEGSFSDLNISFLRLSDNKISDESIAEGAFNRCTLNSLELDDNLLTKMNGESFSGISELYSLSLGGNNITSIEKGAAKHIETASRLILTDNPLERLENGALYGLSKNNAKVWLQGVPIKFISGDLFDDVWNKLDVHYDGYYDVKIVP